MARLQYALLAEFARVDAGGLLTVVGAGFDRVAVPELPAHQSMAVALRLLLAEGEDDVAVVLALRPPEGVQFRFESVVPRPPEARPHQGYTGVPMAINLTVPLLAEGTYRWAITVDGEEQPELSFDVEVLPAVQQDTE